jgi:hypothetical protein
VSSLRDFAPFAKHFAFFAVKKNRSLSEPLIFVIDMINMIGIISVLSASGRHCEERSDEAIQNSLRRSLSESLIFVIDMINMIGIV